MRSTLHNTLSNKASFVIPVSKDDEKSYWDYLEQGASAVMCEPTKSQVNNQRLNNLLDDIEKFSSQHPLRKSDADGLKNTIVDYLSSTPKKEAPVEELTLSPHQTYYYQKVCGKQEDVPPDGNCFFWASARQLIYLLKNNNDLIASLPELFTKLLQEKLPAAVQALSIKELLTHQEMNRAYQHPMFGTAVTNLEFLFQKALRNAVVCQLDFFIRRISDEHPPDEKFAPNVNFIRGVLQGAIAEREITSDLLLIAVTEDTKAEIEKLKVRKGAPILLKQGNDYSVFGSTDGKNWKETKLNNGVCEKFEAFFPKVNSRFATQLNFDADSELLHAEIQQGHINKKPHINILRLRNIGYFLAEIENQIVRPIKEELSEQKQLGKEEEWDEKVQHSADAKVAALIRNDNDYRKMKWNVILGCLKDLLRTDGYYVGDEASLLLSWLFPNIAIKSITHNDEGVIQATQYFFNRQRSVAVPANVPTIHLVKVPWAHYNSAGVILGDLPFNPPETNPPSSIPRPSTLNDEDKALIRAEIRKALGIKDVPIAHGNKDGASVFPYQISPKRGVVPPDESGHFLYVNPGIFKSKFFAKPASNVPYRVVVNIPFYAGSVHSISEVVKVFENTGFGSNREASVLKAINALVFVVGVNMMESLDPDRNTKVKQKLDEKLTTTCEVHCFGFYWRPKWINQEGQEISFDAVRAHYLEVKRENPVHARHILKSIEKASIKMVPYREIREVLKQHVYTSRMAEIFRKTLPNIPVYLGLFDPDMISASAVFDTYTDLITTYQAGHANQAPTVLTTGYRIPHMDAPLHAFAVELDMAVRHATASNIKNGVYYPEPNILVLFNANSMGESFMEGASLMKPKNYNESYEWPTFMEDLIQKRGINPNDHFIFDASNPVITAMPDRMQYVLGKEKDKLLKVFCGQFNNHQEIIRWRISDLRLLIETAQSHALPKSWSSRLLRSVPSQLDAKEIAVITTKTKKPQNKKFKEFRAPLEKVLKVFFEQLDPLSILSNTDVKSVVPEMKRFAAILLNYFNSLPTFLPDLDKNDLDEALRQIVEPTSIALSVAQKEQESIFRKWKNEELQAFILYVLGQDVGQQFIRAGFAAAKALASLYMNKLNTRFSEFTMNFLENFCAECENKANKKYSISLPRTKTQETILTGNYNPNDPRFTREQLLEEGSYHLNGLHFAALVGDYKLVSYALKLVSADIEAQAGLLPLHCAILYLINNGVSETNGNDLPLVTCLVSDITRFKKTDLGLTALGMALTFLDNAASVVKQCMLGWNVPNFILEEIETMARLASLRERQTPLLAIMNKVSKYTPRSLLECAKHGFSFLEYGMIEDRILTISDAGERFEKLEEIATSLIAEAVRQDNLAIFLEAKEAYVKEGIQFSATAVDRDGRPLAISAVVNCGMPHKWLERLEELRVPILVSDPSDGSPILHETICPYSMRYLGGGARNQKRYEKGFRDFLIQVSSKKPVSLKKMLAIEFLLRQPGINFDEKDAVGERALDIALQFDYALVAWWLIKAGARFNYLDHEQIEELIELLNVSYFLGDVDKEKFSNVMQKHPDGTDRFRKKWQEATHQVDEMKKDWLANYKSFGFYERNLKKLFDWIKARYPVQELEAFSNNDNIDAYLEYSFELYLIAYEDVVSIISLPEKKRFEELKKLHSKQLELYRELKETTSDMEKDVGKKVVPKLQQEANKTNKKEKKKLLKKALKKQGMSARQFRMRTHANTLGDITSELEETQSEIAASAQLLPDVQGAAAVSTNTGVEAVVKQNDTLQVVHPPSSAKKTDEGNHAEMVQHIFFKVMEKLGYEEHKSQSKEKEEEIKEYVAALLKEETTNTLPAKLTAMRSNLDEKSFTSHLRQLGIFSKAASVEMVDGQAPVSIALKAATGRVEAATETAISIINNFLFHSPVAPVEALDLTMDQTRKNFEGLV